MKPRLVVLLGAGSTIAAGVPSTKELTDRVKQLRRPAGIASGTPYLLADDPKGKPLSFPYSAPKPVCEAISEALTSQYQEVDFELILAALEELEPFLSAKRPLGMVDKFRPVVSVFTELSSFCRAVLDEPAMLNRARMEIIRTIFDSLFDPARYSPDLSELLGNLQEYFELTVFTLNYDDLVDKTLISWFDGFGPSTFDDGGRQYQVFNRRNFVERFSQEPRVLVHVHGSLHFGSARTTPNFEIVKFLKIEDARASLETSHSYDTDRGTIISPGPIVSGFHKVAKLAHNPAPFGYYYRALTNALIEHPRLLVIGYGGRDEHVNTWLHEFAELHGAARRVAFVSKLSLDDMFNRRPVWDVMRELAGIPSINEPPTDPDSDFQIRGSLALISSGFPFRGRGTLERIVAFFGNSV